MSGIEVIVAALAAGAGAGVSGTATEAIRDAYAGLKDLIGRRLSDRDNAKQVLEADETEAAVWQTRIGRDLLDSGAANDAQILSAARKLLALAAPDKAATFTITANTINGGVGTFNGPVTFDQRAQLPPTPPAVL